MDIKSDRPSVHEALQRLDRACACEKHKLLKVIHGYGSSGVGGDIRAGVQKRLQGLVELGQLRGCIFGENWSKSDETTWKLLHAQPELKNDPHLSRGNHGITVILL